MAILAPNYLFIHVSKCAGQSITCRLVGYRRLDRSIPGHAPLSFFAPEIVNSRFCFGFVRNPWDRALSMYLFSRAKRKHMNLAGYREATSLDFKHWLINGRKYNKYDSSFSGIPDLPPLQRRSQMYWLEGCDYIGKVETLGHDLKIIEARIGNSLNDSLASILLRPFRGLPYRNRTSRGPYRDYLTTKQQILLLLILPLKLICFLTLFSAIWILLL
ncbi:MAG: sulfotransferase family protein [Cyanobacteria bacterium K_Offshore_0m_m2_072]|nr:sulfotransferase family protein [Cyanobacteria bacterium K_Offshore_0m_m2_072]